MGRDEPIYVTRPYLPDIDRYSKYLAGIYQNKILTNDGPLLKLLEERLSQFLNVKNVILVTNGTVALQISLKALGLKGKVATTPFSFVATTNSLIWEGLEPVYVDINPHTLNTDPNALQAVLEKHGDITGILPVHVFGNPCDVKAIERIAQEHGNLPILYDAAHAFGVTLNDQPVLNYGKLSTLSFHATKVFHTIEGGAIISDDEDLVSKIKALRQFGMMDDEMVFPGINAKMSEFHAAMGLSVLEDMEEIMSCRKMTWNSYFENMPIDTFTFKLNADITQYNYSYFPIIFNSESELLAYLSKAHAKGIYPRRYFYPSLNTLDFSKGTAPISEEIAKRILCLPIYSDDYQIYKRVINI